MCDTSAPPGNSPKISEALAKYASPGMLSMFLPCGLAGLDTMPFRVTRLLIAEVGADAGIGRSEYIALCGVEVRIAAVDAGTGKGSRWAAILPSANTNQTMAVATGLQMQ